MGWTERSRTLLVGLLLAAAPAACGPNCEDGGALESAYLKGKTQALDINEADGADQGYEDGYYDGYDDGWYDGSAECEA